MSNSSSQYPRTGRRGVPQQFPIKLYGMLEAESDPTRPEHERIISWSASGKAFHIEDTTLFSTSVLPKYFRTNKFSSFQRNLNLYGFSKVKRGADMDMYAHDSFIRGRPDLLAQLKKCKSKSSEVRNIISSHRNTTVAGYNMSSMYQKGQVNPFHSQPSNIIAGLGSFSSFENEQVNRAALQAYGTLRAQHTNTYFSLQGPSVSSMKDIAHYPDCPQKTIREVSRSPTTMGSDDNSYSDETHDSSMIGKKRGGKLDLLTFAVNCLEDSTVHA